MSVDDLAYGLGKACGIVGIALLVLQCVLSSRLKALDRVLGLDRALLLHRGVGILALGLLFVHPLGLVVGSRDVSLLGFQVPWYIMVGKIALGLLLVSAALGICMGRVRIDYVWLRMGHGKLAGGVLLLGFLHGWMSGGKIQSFPLNVPYGVLFLSFLGIVSFRQWVKWRRPRLRVVSIQEQARDGFTLTLRSDGGTLPEFRAGQFGYFSFLAEGMPKEDHPFSMSSSPVRPETLSISFKVCGDYTKKMAGMKEGTLALWEGPLGRFCLPNEPNTPLLFLAGGVGITPIMSMLRYLNDTGDSRETILFYGCRKEEDLFFRKELEALSDPIRVHWVLSQSGPDWQGSAGHVTGKLISEQASRLLPRAHVYLCGPPAMTRDLILDLRSLGVDKRRLHVERFAL